MGCRILVTECDGEAVLYDSVTDWAFGPIFPSEDHAEDFLEWLEKTTGDGDPRSLTNAQLGTNFDAWWKDRCDDKGDLKEVETSDDE